MKRQGAVVAKATLKHCDRQTSALRVGMALLQLILLALLFVSVFSQDRIPHVRVILGDPFTLPENCQTEEDGRLYRVRVYETPEVEVAAHKRGVWKPAEVYQERISENSSVVFNPAVYTDTGLYELSCGARKVHIQVKVVTSSERAVSEGAAVSLPCYVSTTGSACWSLRWEKNGTVVFERSSCAGRSTGAADHRLSVSANWLLHGDFSLNLQQARSDDQGDYFCYIQDEVVTAVRLTVRERSPDQTPSTPPLVSPICDAEKETRPQNIASVITITAFVTLLIAAPSAAGCGWWLKSRRSGSSSGGDGGLSPGVERTPLTDRRTFIG